MASVGEPKRLKLSNGDDNDEKSASFGQLTAEKIKEMMANAQKAIQERKNQLNMAQQPAAPCIIPPLPGQMMMPKGPAPNLQQSSFADSEKLKKASELQARIQAKLANVGLANVVVPVPNSAGTGPTPVILDEYGRTIDPTTGQAIQLQHHTPTLKANIRAKKREQFKAVQERPQEEMTDSSFYDPRLGPIQNPVRNRRMFRFHEPGKYERIGQRIRTKAQLEKLQGEILQAAKKTGIATAAKLASIQPKKEAIDDVPDVEWWDRVILKNDFCYPNLADETNKSVVFEGITNLVEHPIQMKPPVEKNKSVEIPVMLTKTERKKLRRQNRNEIQKEKQEKIRLGLTAPPEPRVKLANMMRVLASDAVQDPTKVEAHVKQQMEKRQKAHQDRNAGRKLTKEQRREKMIRKIKEDTSDGVHVSVYRVMDLTNPSHRFKVEANASQLFMTGIVVLHKDCNVIVVEGGPKQQGKFRTLVMRRIKWSNERHKEANDDDDENDDEDEKKTNDCKLVWEGTVKSRSFGEMKVKNCPTESFARETFKKHAAEHYWDLAFSSTILETTFVQPTI
ncbi:hypothetical protein HELRODRAFT_98250 [Helobdella robusta]|uniref:Uncharacterized protein n=1 Tax=Helobdella robusta TaxID=6412 RepID=T1G9L3_HELRO|nr:hypothetical protein HELRODRAFT_98250 [Helobdella robusta]ESO08130.1 hypothetical protein HELRODRAFT_98250 [Helobdella robusta]